MVVWVLLMAGDHDPWILLLEVVCKAGIELPKQYGPTAANVGMMLWSISMVKVAVLPH